MQGYNLTLLALLKRACICFWSLPGKCVRHCFNVPISICRVAHVNFIIELPGATQKFASLH